MNKKLSGQANTWISVVTMVVVLAIIGIVSELFWHDRLDLTENKQFTLNRASLKTLENLPDIITIKAVISKDLPTQFAQVRTQVLDLLQEFEARSDGKINLVVEDPGTDEEKKRQATSLGIQEVQLQEANTESMEIKKGFFGLAITYGDKKEVIPVLADIQSFEYDLVVNIKKLTGATKTLGVVEGSEGNKFSFTVPGQPPRTAEGFDENYPTLKQELEKLYQIQKVNLTSQVDTAVDMVLIVAPKTLTDLEKFNLDQFIMQGRSAMFLTPGVDVNLSYGINGTATNNNYEDLLTHYGMSVQKNVIVDRVNLLPVHFGNSFFPIPYPYWIRCLGEYLNQESAITASLGQVTFPWPSSLELDTTNLDSSVHLDVLVHSSEDSWVESGSFNLLPKSLNEFLPINQKSRPIAALKTAKFRSFYADNEPPADSAANIDPLSIVKQSQNPSHLLVVGNALFASDFYIGFTNSVTNLHMVLNAVDQLALDPELISIRNRELTSRPIEPEKLDQKVPVLLFNLLAAPVLLIIGGMAMGFRRRRRDA